MFPSAVLPIKMSKQNIQFFNFVSLPIVCTVYVSKYTRHVDPIRVTICICYPTATIPETDFPPPDTELQGRPMPKRDFCVMVTWRYAWMPSVQHKKTISKPSMIFLSMVFQSIFGEFYMFYHTVMYNYPLYLTESCDYVTQS